MVLLKNNKWINYSDEELLYKKKCISDFLKYKNSLNIDEIQLKIDKQIIKNFINNKNLVKSGMLN